MALSPDVIFELFLPTEPAPKAADEIAGFVQMGLPVPVQQPESVWNPDKNVLSLGFWIDKGGFTDEQLKASLRASSFISGTGSMTAGLFVSTAFIQGAVELGWSQQPKKVDESVGYITFDNSINVVVSSAGIVTKVTGSYHPPVLPSIGFTYTISDTLTLNQSSPPALKANESTHLQLSTLGVIEEAFLLGLLHPILGNIVFFGGLFGAGLFDPNQEGVGAQLAEGWPSDPLTPISPPLTGKLNFNWTKLNVDDSGVRTLGTWNLALRSPQVRIVGPRALSFKEGQPGATGFYTVELTDLVKDGATLVWGGEAAGSDLDTMVQFDTGGDFSITARVTDVDNVSAAAAMNVTVTESDDGHHHPP